MKPVYIIALLLLSVTRLSAQQTICGTVTDCETRQPLEMVSVTLTQGASPAVLHYTLTDRQGQFRFSVAGPDSLQVNVTCLGYRRESLPAASTPMDIRLKPATFRLKEVQIKGGRISTRQDTTRYDLARFASSKDQSIKDVLKRLPGMDVDDNSGQIRYNGKAIDHFYVEGMDVTGGSYNQVSENLRSDAVESAEIIEHHQPIRSLRGKIPTDKVALNLRLNPHVRSRWLLTAKAGEGYGKGYLYNHTLNAMQLARERQGIYTYKNDNSGKDLAAELAQLTDDNLSDVSTDQLNKLVVQPALDMPLEKTRLLDNETHLVAINRLYQKDEEHQHRFIFRYLHDEQQRKEGTAESYFYASDTLHTHEQHDYRLHTDRVEGSYNYEHNGETYFARNLMKFSGSWNRGYSRIDKGETISQQLDNGNIELQNHLHLLSSDEHRTRGFRSYTHLSYLPSELSFGNLTQQLETWQAFTATEGYFRYRKNEWSMETTGGINGQLTFFHQQSQQIKAHRIKVFVTPALGWENNQLRLRLTCGTSYLRYPWQAADRWQWNPKLFVYYHPTPRWELYAMVSSAYTDPEPASFYPLDYQSDYRTRISGTSFLPYTRNQIHYLSAQYKRAVREFFWKTDLIYQCDRSNQLPNTTYDGETFHLTTLRYQWKSKSYTVKSIVSKGFYYQHLKTAFEVLATHGEGIQAGQGELQTYRYNILQMIPKITWTPTSWFDATYRAVLTRNDTRFGNSSELPGLWNIRQQLSLSFSAGRNFSATLTGEHYYNELDIQNSHHTGLVDLILRYRAEQWSFNLSLTNLLDQNTYRYTVYTDVRNRTTWTEIRPREIMISTQYSF